MPEPNANKWPPGAHIITCFDCKRKRPTGTCYWPLCPHLPEEVRTGKKPRGSVQPRPAPQEDDDALDLG